MTKKAGKSSQASKSKTTKKQKATRKKSRILHVDPQWWLERLSAKHIKELADYIEKAQGLAAAEACPSRVVRVIEEWGGGTVNSGGDTLKDVSVNQQCTPGRVADLRDRLA